MSDERGFTMIEVMIGIGLIMLVTAGMAMSTIGSIRTTALSSQMTTASSLVHDKIEQLRSLDPSTNPADLIAGDHLEAAGTINHHGDGGGAFTRTWVVTEDAPILGVSQVVVSVAWSGPKPQVATGVTYVCENPSCT